MTVIQFPVRPIPQDVSSENERSVSRDGIVLTVASAIGGLGKSSVALLLGTTLAQSSRKSAEKGLTDSPLSVVVVDLAKFDGGIGGVIGQLLPTALNIALSSTPEDPNTIKNNLVYNARMGIHTLLAPVLASNATFTSEPFYRYVVRTLKTMFDVVILDTSNEHTHVDLFNNVALPEADAILMVSTLDVKSVNRLAEWMNIAVAPVSSGGLGIDSNKIGIVANRTVQGVGIGHSELTAASLGSPLLVGIPLDSVAVQAATNATRLEDIIYHPTIGPAYFKLASKIIKRRGIELAPLVDDKNNK